MSAEIYLQTMEIIARSLPDVSDGTLESQLQTFQLFIGLCGEEHRGRAAALLKDAAARSRDVPRKASLEQAAERVAAGIPLAEPPVVRTATEADWAAMKKADPSLAGPPLLHLTPWDMFPGLVVRIGTTFTARGDTFSAGELLRFRELNFLPGHEGYTLRFEERTIYLCGLDPADAPVLDNAGNQYFEPYPTVECLKACCKLARKQWRRVDRSEIDGGRAIGEELGRCWRWLKAEGDRGPAPFCSMGENAMEMFDGAEGADEGLGFRLAFLFTGIGLCVDAVRT